MADQLFELFSEVVYYQQFILLFSVVLYVFPKRKTLVEFQYLFDFEQMCH